ncbi:MAG: hypothetical protein KBD12_00560 [Candidatus Pacebacteria bacterium]|nr:hypothetical protein [Candidatus Paceibacterota bacterium]
MKKIILNIISISFIFLFVSTIAKADTYQNIGIITNGGTTAHSYPYTVTVQTDKQIYNAGELVTTYLSYSSATTPSTSIDTASNMNIFLLSTGDYQFGFADIRRFRIGNDFTPGVYSMYMTLPSNFRSQSASQLQASSLNNKFDMLSFVSDFFIKKASACLNSVYSCNVGEICENEMIFVCHPHGGTGIGSTGSGSGVPIVSTTFTVTESSPKIFSK